MVLDHADIAVVVTDRLCNLLYVNDFAVRLFRISGDASRLAGCPVVSLGLFADDGVRKTEDLAGQVLRGRSWEGTFESERGDGSRTLVRGIAVPLRHPGGDIDGTVILVREAGRRDGHGQQDRIALLERVGERLAGSLEIGTTLKHVAEILVPQFDEHHYDAPDRDLIGAIASRVAIAIDNAMLFETERQTALAFQKSLLPQAIPDLDGMEVACRYVPAKPLETQGQGIQTQVGGDWYDIIPLAAGRVGIVIGDVDGRGARAAAITGQLRAALRAFAQAEKPPAAIKRKLDELRRALAPAGENGTAAGD